MNFCCQVDSKFLFKGHHFYSEEVLNNFINSPVKTLTIVRDPRDTLISMCYWFSKDPYQVQDASWANSSVTEKAKLLLKRGENLFGKANVLYYQLSLQEELIKKKDVLVTRFEHLVGAKGGGDDRLQREELLKMANFLGLELNDRQLAYLKNNLFGRSYSFRKGKIGNVENLL